MSFIARPRTNSDISSSTHLSRGVWGADLFQRYQLPPSTGTADSDSHRVEYDYLGVSLLTHGSQCVLHAAFYEVKEIHGPERAMSIDHEGMVEYMEDALSPLSPASEAPLVMDDKRALFSPPMALPPKKRRRHKILRHDIIFCLFDPPADPPCLPCPNLDYFLFPHDAITEAINETPPLDVFFSYHADVEERRPYATKLEEFAAVCSSAAHCRSSTNPEDARSKVVNMRMSGVSQRLYHAIKQSVYEFEALCDKMVQLMKFHTQQTTGIRAAACPSSPPFLSRPIPRPAEAAAAAATTTTTQPRPPLLSPIPTEPAGAAAMRVDPQSEWEEMLNATSRTAFEQRLAIEDKEDEQQRPPKQHARSASAGSAVKKCLYCGSKSTPMWRRGPQGAGTLCNACGVKWKHGKILSGMGSSSNSNSNDAAAGTVAGAVTTIPSIATNTSILSPMISKDTGRRASEKRRKKSTGSIKRSNGKSLTTIQRMSDDDMESNIAAAQNLSINDNKSAFAVPWPRDPSTSHLAHSLSSSSSPSPARTSPPLSVIVQHRRHTVDMASLSDAPFAGVDAVEAAAVLTLLRRS
ncbi:hypothetical protein BX666DRAFT_2030176 [Dichotomocladium elegans]|nr:hypothetical protein BX666DRAFT_2030176 [Dichotomocladium elegans]